MPEPVLHVVFSASAAGLLRQALRVAGRRERVWAANDNLSIGPISSDVETRIQWMVAELDEPFTRERVTDDEALLERCRSGAASLTVWYAPDRAPSLAGFHWFVHGIGDVPISTVEAPKLGMFGVQPMLAFVGREVGLSRAVRDRRQGNWRRLLQEDALLRVLRGDELISVPLDYFDSFFLARVTHEWKRVTRVVGECFSELHIEAGHDVEPGFVLSRLRALAASGAIEWAADVVDNQQTTIRLTPT